MSDVEFVKIISIWCPSVQFGRRSMKSIQQDWRIELLKSCRLQLVPVVQAHKTWKPRCRWNHVISWLPQHRKIRVSASITLINKDKLYIQHYLNHPHIPINTKDNISNHRIWTRFFPKFSSNSVGSYRKFTETRPVGFYVKWWESENA